MADVTPILPTVRQVIVCHELSLDDTLGSWVVTAPLSVSFLPPGMSFPFRADQVAVYTQLVGGLGAITFGIELRQRMTPLGGTESSYRDVGVYFDSTSYSFPGGMNRLAVHELAFRIADVPFEREGSYEFRVVAQLVGETLPLEGPTATITVLSADGGTTDG